MSLAGPITMTLPVSTSGRMVVDDALCRLLAMSPNDAPAYPNEPTWTPLRWQQVAARIQRRYEKLRTQWARTINE